MISEVKTSKGIPAITSDQWHVVRSQLLYAGTKRPYARAIHSEHADRKSCGQAAKTLRHHLLTESTGKPNNERDEVFICRPNFKSLKLAMTRHKTTA